ncbi:MAG TPA: VOC family protein [Pseudolabrys sp.]|nr:VOC family protein [Pseudolabrys sp.]
MNDPVDMKAPPPAVLSLVTLGVAGLERSIVFYERLGFRRKMRSAEGVGFFEAGAAAFAVFPVSELARDAGVDADSSATGASSIRPAAGPEMFRGMALAWNCATRAGVDQALARARAAGAVIRKPAQETFWGGYAGYFADPDGHLWEVAFNPGFPLSEDGRLAIPD